MINNKNSLVIQHNKLIQAKYELSVQEKRFILWLISQINYKDEDFKHYQVSIQELAKFIGLESFNYKRMTEITERLMKRIITIEMIEEQKLIQIAWLRYAEYQYGKGIMKVGFAPELMPYLLQLKSNFTTFQLTAILSLSSIYAIRLYELLKQYEMIGYRQITLNELRHILSIENHEYKLYGHFKVKVLQIAKREINIKTDLHIEIEEIKESRRVAALGFHISHNPNYHKGKDSLKPSLPDEQVEISPELINKLKYFGISRQKVLELVSTYDEKTIFAKLQDFEAAIDSGKQIKNPSGWLLSAIEKDWNYRSPYQIEQERQEQAKQERLEKERLKSAEKAKKELELRHYKLAFDSHIRALFWPRWNALSKEQQEQLATQVISNPVEQRSYNKKGAESPVVLAKLLPHVLSLEELDFESWYASMPL